ncbi:glycosyltransferase family 4 protein [Tychonema sp. BBK16]|uniref:glycosyltransferase family 4 protein n=1 Tax=Tychonema sp. BBK16 TaxID=2699888 RepID=UPI001F3619D3|nr:glycosyltransferase family 4 protein [Tychonema sp. BBK16]MCF6372668.1 glycosyltransferase family 4 protein [Tychonema sp. BBK16]
MSSLLIITTVPGTIRAFLLPFAHHFREQGWKVHAMACGISENAECLQAFDRVWDVEWSRNPLDPRNFLAAPQVIREVVKTEKYDIIHVHTPVAAFVARYALKDLKKQQKFQVIYTAHGFHFHPLGKPLKNSVFLNLEKLAGPWTDYLVTINHEDESAAKRYKILPAERVRYMPGIGVDLDRYSPRAVAEADVAKVRQKMGLNEENQLFISAIEFIPRKHPQDVLTAFAKLARPDVHLVFAGDGPMFAEMQQLASDLGVQNQVHFLGSRRDVATLMRASVATLLASEQEGLPRSIMESLSLEIPVIATNIRGNQELLESGCGLLFDVGDIDGFAQAMAWMLDHPEDVREMGKRGRDRMATCDVGQIVKMHEELYAEAVQK